MSRQAKSSWRDDYELLCDYAFNCSSISVGPRSLSIPVDLREGFYARVSAIQRGIVDEVLGGRTAEAARVSELCASVRSEILARTGLKSFTLAPGLERFLADSKDALSAPAFSPVLNALQNRLPCDELAETAGTQVRDHGERLLRCAYEAWAYYGIVLALKPVKFWSVWSPDTVTVQPAETEEVVIGFQVNSPERRMPEAIFQTEDGRCFAMKSEAANELDFYGIKITRKRDNSAGGNTAGVLGHRVLLLYGLDSAESVSSIVDRQKLQQTPCDLMCEVLGESEMTTPEYLSIFVQRINSIRPRRPVQVLLLDAKGGFPSQMIDDPSVTPVECRVVGLDEGKLAEIAGLLNQEEHRLVEMRMI